MKHHNALLRLGTAVAAGLLLAACNDVDRLPSDDHDHEPVESSGRLVFGEVDSDHSHVHVYDLHDGAAMGEFELDHPVTAIHSSPELRYAVVLQRDDDRVNFVDGGLWTEEHGDHDDAFEEDPLLAALQIDACVRPTHYEAHDGVAALFCDGLASSGAPAGIRLFSDESIGLDQEIATHGFDTWQHGTAEPRDEWLLTTHREADAEGTLPNRVELYELHGDHFHFERRFETPCEGLHGSFSNHDYILFGCDDGVLVVHQTGDTGDDFADSKIGIPDRISQLAGHHDLDQFAGFGGSVLYAIDPAAGTAQEVDWRNGVDELERVTHAIDGHGEHLLILDNEGALHILDPHDGWNTVTVVPEVALRMDGDPSIVIAPSRADDVVFVTDPANARIVMVDVEHGEVEDHIEPGFAPVGLAWVGIAGEHEH